jgi:predicted small secreted protein
VQAMAIILHMKCIALCFACLALSSCNTSIGVWRDMKQGYHWTKNKIQESGSGGDVVDPYGAPTY